MIPRTRRVCQIVNDVADGPQPPLEMLQVCDILRDQALGVGAPFVDPLAEHRIADAPNSSAQTGFTSPTPATSRWRKRIEATIANTLTQWVTPRSDALSANLLLPLKLYRSIN
jgi:hypothetical protein